MTIIAKTELSFRLRLAVLPVGKLSLFGVVGQERLQFLLQYIAQCRTCFHSCCSLSGVDVVAEGLRNSLDGISCVLDGCLYLGVEVSIVLLDKVRERIGVDAAVQRTIVSVADGKRCYTYRRRNK